MKKMVMVLTAVSTVLAANAKEEKLDTLRTYE